MIDSAGGSTHFGVGVVDPLFDATSFNVPRWGATYSSGLWACMLDATWNTVWSYKRGALLSNAASSVAIRTEVDQVIGVGVNFSTSTIQYFVNGIPLCDPVDISDMPIAVTPAIYGDAGGNLPTVRLCCAVGSLAYLPAGYIPWDYTEITPTNPDEEAEVDLASPADETGSGTFTFPIHAKSDACSITITTQGPRQFCLLNADWIGTYHKKSQRI